MAKSDTDSNGLRQDQPECTWAKAQVGMGGYAHRDGVRTCYRVWVGDTRPGVTELPGLTSDSIYTADRRGGILISFGPNRSPRWVINPPELDRSVSEDGVERPQPRRVSSGHDGPGRASGQQRAVPTSVIRFERLDAYKGIEPRRRRNAIQGRLRTLTEAPCYT